MAAIRPPTTTRMPAISAMRPHLGFGLPRYGRPGPPGRPGPRGGGPPGPIGAEPRGGHSGPLRLPSEGADRPEGRVAPGTVARPAGFPYGDVGADMDPRL